ncbi:MAG: hypothetical protein JJ902_09195 [Roseibium sp.]|nr:hypothetical protein [Roseibium sp.]
MSSVDPKVALEIERARADLKHYADNKSVTARNSAIGVLTFVALVLGLAAMFGIDHLIGMRMTTELGQRVHDVVEEELPNLVPDELRRTVPLLINEPIEEFLSGSTFENNLASAVQAEFQDRVPGDVVAFISAQQRLLDELDAQAEMVRQSMAAVDSERAFRQEEFDQQMEATIVGAWRPSGLLGQIHAQATCVALAKHNAWITAVPRLCQTDSISCQQVCAAIGDTTKDSQLKGASNRYCEAAIHIYQNLPSSEINSVGLKTYKYPNCNNNSCGPNYCCCSSF